MHEMALAESLLQVLEEQATQHGYGTVRTVWLEIGALAGVEPEALRFSFEVVARGTLAEGAVLRIVDTGAEAWCPGCAASVTVSARLDACPECGGDRLRLTGGQEMRVSELEVA